LEWLRLDKIDVVDEIFIDIGADVICVVFPLISITNSQQQQPNLSKYSTGK
jgi:hypothetical protein